MSYAPTGDAARRAARGNGRYGAAGRVARAASAKTRTVQRSSARATRWALAVRFLRAKSFWPKKPPGIAAKPRFPPGNRAPRASLPSALRGRVDCPAGIRAQNSSRQHFLPASPRGKSQPPEKLAIITRRGLFSRGPKTSDACRQEYALGRCLAKTPEEEHKAITSPRIKIPLGKVRS